MLQVKRQRFTFVAVADLLRGVAYFEDPPGLDVVGEAVEELSVDSWLGQLLLGLQEFVNARHKQQDPDDHQEVTVEGLVGHPRQDLDESHAFLLPTIIT
jgi:hypothetical protein